jgi:hypothetical protein
MERKFNYNQPVKKEFHYANEQEIVTFREYGRNIQNMARHLLTIEDREKRNRMSITLVELMKQLNPVIGEPNDYYQKLWDHLHVMTDLKLDVDGPFPKPDSEILVKKPQTVPYRIGDAKFKHYGRSIELLVKKAIDLEDEEEKEQACIYLCRLMKMFVLSHSKDMIEDSVVIENLKKLSGGKLILDSEKVSSQNLLSINPKDILQNPQGQSQRQGGQNQRNNRNQRFQNNKRRR